ncbi:hypothetical protein LCGC14_0630320 [marine sediment metagenome]|uniref:Bacteriophage Mu GpT domain-containing protein n=1 Tax=marine sediment metagenome TaxID=412755 RepID=A0A0F9UAN7_9ZZZZ
MKKDILEVMKDEKLDPSVGERASKIHNFNERLNTFIELVSNARGYSARKRAYLLEEASSTSDFPLLFGNVLERQLLAKYQIARPDWRNYIAAGTQRDFRPSDAIGIFGLQGRLNTVSQRGEYKQDKELGEGKVSITLKKYGRLFGLGWEAMVNDELGAFNDVAQRLADAALRTEFFQATSLITQSTGPNVLLYGDALTHPIDGATIDNLGTSNLDQAGLELAVAALREQKDTDGEPILIESFSLVVPPFKEIAMLKLLRTDLTMVPTTLATIRLGPAFSITGHVNPYLPIVDTSGAKNFTWYLFANLSSGRSAQLNFMRGREAPQLVMKAPDKQAIGGGDISPLDGDFLTDSMWWRVRHILGGVQIDPRFTFAQVGSA